MPAKSKPRHKRQIPSRTRQGVALGVTTVMSAGAVVAGSGVASAAEKPVSQSKGVFLSGSALGINLDQLVKLDNAAASNKGDQNVVKALNPLGVSLLNSLDVPLGPINLLKGNGLLKLGAVNQAAIAKKDGSAVGASGAVTDSGAIAVSGKDDVPASNADLDLGALLGSTLGEDLIGGLVDLDLSVGAISASATQGKGEKGKQTGDYNIADLKLTLQSPILSGLLGGLDLSDSQSALAGLDGVLNGLNLTTLLSDLLDGLLGGLLGDLTGVDLDVANLPVLSDIVSGQDLTVAKGAIAIDLSNGKITVDVEALLKQLGLDLNNLPPNTELVRLILNAVVENVGNLVQGVVDDLLDDITAAFEDISITGEASLLGGLTEALPVDDLLAALRPTLNQVLSTVLQPVQQLLTQVGGTLLDPIFDVLEDVLSIRVNVQSKSGGAFTQRALQIRVLPDGAGITKAAAGDGLATVNLASATVGPGSGVVAGEETEDEDDGDSTGDGTPLPDTGAGDSAPLAAAGLGLLLAGAAATAGSNRMGTRTAGAHAAPRGRARSGGGRHARR